MNFYSKEEAGHMLCRYHNLDGAEALCGKKGVEKIMRSEERRVGKECM